MQVFKFISLVLPLVGACMLAALIWKSLFITPPLTDGMYLWIVVLLLPFVVAFFSALQCVRTRLRQSIGLLHSVFLSTPPAIGLIDNWNGEIIALLPIYLWSVTVIMTLAGIVADALSSKIWSKKDG